MEEESEEEVGKGEEGGGGGGGGRGGEDEHKGQRPLGCLSESLGMSFGSLLEASWGWGLISPGPFQNLGCPQPSRWQS